MLSYIARRLISVIPLLLIVSTVAFLLLEVVPGDPARVLAGEQASEEDVRSVARALGLDKPLHERYVAFLNRIVRGDLGTSIINSTPIADTIAERLPISLSLFLFAITSAVLLGVSFGMVAALTPDTLIDRLVVTVTSFLLAVPSFVVAVFLIAWLAIEWSFLPATGYTPLRDDVLGWATHLVMPAIALAVHPSAELARMVRGALRDAMQQDYIRTARAKGLRTASVIFKHAARNAAIPSVTVVGLQTARLLGGSAIIESIFGIPGLGTLTISSAISRDVAMVQAIVLVAAVMIIMVNLVIDVSYGILNPKLRT